VGGGGIALGNCKSDELLPIGGGPSGTALGAVIAAGLVGAVVFGTVGMRPPAAAAAGFILSTKLFHAEILSLSCQYRKEV
jgi:hypothetical protein